MTSEEYWIEILGEEWDRWILQEKIWMEYWDCEENPKYDTRMITYGDKGFLIIEDHRKSMDHDPPIHLNFAFVVPKYRGQGVLSKMVKMMREEYYGEKIGLLSMNSYTNKIWEHLGFTCTLRAHNDIYCDEYIISTLS